MHFRRVETVCSFYVEKHNTSVGNSQQQKASVMSNKKTLYQTCTFRPKLSSEDDLRTTTAEIIRAAD